MLHSYKMIFYVLPKVFSWVVSGWPWFICSVEVV